MQASQIDLERNLNTELVQRLQLYGVRVVLKNSDRVYYSCAPRESAADFWTMANRPVTS